MSKNNVISMIPKEKEKKYTLITVSKPEESSIPLDMSINTLILLSANDMLRYILIRFSFVLEELYMDFSPEEIPLYVNKGYGVYLQFEKEFEGSKSATANSLVTYLNIFFSDEGWYSHQTPNDKLNIGDKFVGLKPMEVKVGAISKSVETSIFRELKTHVVKEGYRVFTRHRRINFESVIFFVDNEGVIVDKITIGWERDALEEGTKIFNNPEFIKAPVKENLTHLDFLFFKELFLLLEYLSI